MRLGIYGGSFDPVHYAHLLLAECAREQLQLDQVWLLPAALPPHKQSHVLAPGKARLEMIELALAGDEHLRASPLELDRGGTSYTVETLRRVRQDQPTAHVFLLMGADSLLDLPNWREPAEICRLATPAVVQRAGAPPVDFSVLSQLVPVQRLDEICQAQVQMPLVGLSSTDLRERVAAGQSLRFRTPRAVEKYIEAHGLYRASEAQPVASPSS